MKGIVVEVTEKNAILLNEKGEFKKIKNQKFVVGEKINYKVKRPIYYAACASVAAICLFSASVYGIGITPVGYVDVDINPSIRMEVNSFSRVIEYDALNEDGEKLIPELSRGKVADCLNEIVTLSKDKGYFNKGNPSVEIDVSSENIGLLKKVEEAVKEISDAEDKVDFELVKRDREHYEKANGMKISMGRYKALEDYSDVFGGSPEENVDKLKDKTLQEIKSEIENYIPKTEKEAIREEKAETREELKSDKSNKGSRNIKENGKNKK